jgi:hypothetical protein
MDFFRQGILLISTSRNRCLGMYPSLFSISNDGDNQGMKPVELLVSDIFPPVALPIVIFG